VPNTIHELVLEAQNAGHRVTDDGRCTLIVVNAAAARIVELLLPHDIFEWFITVRDPDGSELYTTWDEAFSVDGETPEELTAMVSGAAARLMRAVAGAELRVVPRPGVRFLGREWLKGHALEILVGDTWVDANTVLYPPGAVEAQWLALRQRAPKGAR